ncbi:MAG: NHL repeat-containing protein [Actinomycetes bacterium]
MTDTTTIQYDEQEGWREADRRRLQRTRRALVGVLVVLVILLLIALIALLAIFRPVGKVASGTEAAGVTWIRSIYGWGKGADQQFKGPQGVGVGPDGIIWATTQAQNRVVGFNPDGSLNTMLYQGPAGQQSSPNAFSYPVATAVDPAGLIYIADQPKSTVWVVNRDNKIVNKFFVPAPASIAVSSDRLVVGSGSGFVILTPTGAVVKVIGTQGKGIDQFSGVRGLAIGKDGTIYVVDQYNNRVSAYDRNGTRKWIISTGNPGNQQNIKKSMVAQPVKAKANMQIPAGMTIDGAGRLVIVDPFGFDITVLDSKDGKLIAKYGNPGSVDGQFVYPSSIAYDPAHDWFAVADTGNGRVQIVRLPNSGGTAVATLNQTLAGPLGACLFPLVLLILILVGALIYRLAIRRRREQEA